MLVVTATSFIKVPELRHSLEAAVAPVPVVYARAEDCTDAQRLREILRPAQAWLLGRESANEALLSTLPQLQIVAKYGVGLDNIDLETCERLGIKVAWEAGVNRDAVAELTIGLMISLCRNMGLSSRRLAQGQWWKNGGRNLTGRRVGLIGLGHIGTRVAELLAPFRCSVRYCDIVDKTVAARALGVQAASYDELLSWAEVLSFHVPLTPHTRKMFDSRALERTQPGVWIVNTSRGEVIDQELLKAALRSGRLAGAALDVFETEPLDDRDLYSLDNFLGTAHIAGNSEEAVLAMGYAAIRGLQKELGLSGKNSDLC
jgi:phosphoglycerate dehydrogenase-like enzyme